MSNTTHTSDYPLDFRCNILERFIMLKIYDKNRDEKLQYAFNGEAANISDVNHQAKLTNMSILQWNKGCLLIKVEW